MDLTYCERLYSTLLSRATQVVAFNFLLISHLTLSAQTQLERPNFNILSPQTYEFARYGNVPISYFTGETNVKVPIYTYKDKDFELPISLGYNASGFRPNKRENIVGLNWYLTGAGGAVTRKVNGVPDEVGKTVYDPSGYYVGIKNNRAYKSMAKADLFSFSFPYSLIRNDGGIDFNVDGCEMEPDDFNFNTADGKSGKFFLENTGEVRVVGNKAYKIDLSGLATYPSGTVSTPSSIKITTDDGYVYSFGGSEQYLEISYQLASAGQIDKATIVAWHLSKIEAPNGRTVIFEYEPYPNLGNVNSPTPSSHMLYTSYMYSSGLSAFIPLGPNPVPIPMGTQSIAHEVTKSVYLKRIVVDNHTNITFYNNERERKFYPSSAAYFNTKGLKLDSVLVTTLGDFKPIHRYRFGYEYLGGFYARLFLTSFGEVGIPPYQFEYYNTAPLPDPSTYSVDHWGFWNGRESNQALPNMYFDPATLELTYVSDAREPNPEILSNALLKRQYYPTGGYTEFTYERHDYRKRRQRNVNIGTWPELVYMNGQKIAGGVRIKTIVDHDGKSETNRREFRYVNTDIYPHQGPSSGILMNWPQNVFYVQSPNGTQFYIDQNNYNTEYYPGEPYMQYPNVTELDASGGCTTYKFTSYEDHPDLKEHVSLEIGSPPDPNNPDFLLMRPNDHSHERGHLLEVTTYASRPDATFYPVTKKITSYTEKSDNPDAFVVGLRAVMFSESKVQSYKTPYHPFLPKEERVVTYSEEGAKAHEVITQITYDNLGYVTTRSSTGSDNSVSLQRFRYVSDFISKTDEQFLFTGSAPTPTATYLSLTPELKALADLRKNNILNKPIEVIDYFNGNVSRASLVYYKDFASVNFSKNVYPYQSWATITNPSGFTLSGVTKGTTWNFIKHNSYGSDARVTIDKVDDIGNPIELTDSDKTKVSYVWGNNKLRPVAEVVGCASNRVYYTGFEDTDFNETTDCRTGNKCRSGAFSKGLTNLSSGLYKVSFWKKNNSQSVWELVESTATVSGSSYSISIPSTYRIDDVRFIPADIPVLVNTFTYDVVGRMTSKTDANNKSQFFSYDALGHLKLIRDFNGDVVKSFDYQFKGN